MQPIPVDRYLVPATGEPLPDTYSARTSPIDASVPQMLQLDAEWQVTLAIPTGLGTTWRDAGATTPILDSKQEARGSDPAAPQDMLVRPPARLIVRGANGIAAVLPLVLGARTQISGIELVVTGFAIDAGTMRGASGSGSSVSLAWRRTTAATDHFSDPPMNTYLMQRIQPKYRLQSITARAIDRFALVRRTVKPLREIITWR